MTVSCRPKGHLSAWNRLLQLIRDLLESRSHRFDRLPRGGMLPKKIGFRKKIPFDRCRLFVNVTNKIRRGSSGLREILGRPETLVLPFRCYRVDRKSLGNRELMQGD